MLILGKPVWPISFSESALPLSSETVPVACFAGQGERGLWERDCSLTTESKIDQSRSSSLGDFKGLTRFRRVCSQVACYHVSAPFFSLGICSVPVRTPAPTGGVCNEVFCSIFVLNLLFCVLKPIKCKLWLVPTTWVTFSVFLSFFLFFSFLFFFFFCVSSYSLYP